MNSHHVLRHVHHGGPSGHCKEHDKPDTSPLHRFTFTVDASEDYLRLVDGASFVQAACRLAWAKFVHKERER